MSEIVNNDISVNGTSYRNVRLTGLYSEYGINETYALFSNHYAKLFFIADDKKPRTQKITAKEMDELAALWLQFRKDCADAKEAEQKRLAGAKAEAFKIAQDTPGLTIEPDTDYDDREYWTVKQDDIHFNEFAYDPDQLLTLVIEAQNQHIQHTLNINEAKEIVKAHREIKVTEIKSGTKHWRVSIPDKEGPYAEPCTLYNTTDLLTSIKEALAWLEQQKAEQSASDSKEVVNQ